MGAQISNFIYLMEKTASESDSPDPVIPSVSISGASGSVILERLSIAPLYAELVGARKETYPSLMVDLAIVLVCITLIGIVLLSLYHCCKQFQRRHALTETNDSDMPAHDEAMVRRALKVIPLRRISTGENVDEENVCAICIEPFIAKDDVRTLPCEHVFHQACLDPWLLTKPTCPLCKDNVLEHLNIHKEHAVVAEPANTTTTTLFVGSEVMELMDVHTGDTGDVGNHEANAP